MSMIYVIFLHTMPVSWGLRLTWLRFPLTPRKKVCIHWRMTTLRDLVCLCASVGDESFALRAVRDFYQSERHVPQQELHRLWKMVGTFIRYLFRVRINIYTRRYLWLISIPFLLSHLFPAGFDVGLFLNFASQVSRFIFYRKQVDACFTLFWLEPSCSVQRRVTHVRLRWWIFFSWKNNVTQVEVNSCSSRFMQGLLDSAAFTQT